MGSNLTFQSRNVLSKKLMGGKSLKNAEAGLDNINLFSLITIASFFLTIPVVLLAEGVRFMPAAMAAAGVDVSVVMQRTLLAGLMFHAYQQVSYMILSKVSPVTHSVGNCVKRVVVIVSSVLFFRTPVVRPALCVPRCCQLTLTHALSVHLYAEPHQRHRHRYRAWGRLPLLAVRPDGSRCCCQAALTHVPSLLSSAASPARRVARGSEAAAAVPLACNCPAHRAAQTQKRPQAGHLLLVLSCPPLPAYKGKMYSEFRFIILILY